MLFLSVRDMTYFLKFTLKGNKNMQKAALVD